MADLPAIPPALVEAAARAHAEHLVTVVAYGTLPNPRHGWQCSCDAGRRLPGGLVSWRQASDEAHAHAASAALAAALAECEVRVEFACPDGDGGLGWHTYRCPDVTHHRLVVTLPASPVDTPREDAS